MPVYWPNGSLTVPRATSEFNPARKNPVTGIVQPHNGIDLVGWVDNCSPVDGTVIFAGYNGGAGNEVRIRADGPTAFHVGDVFRILHHASLYVRTGQRVTARQAVGRMGTTGNSTGVHCHFETHEFRYGNPINPRDFMARANTTTAGGAATGGESRPDPTLGDKDSDDMKMIGNSNDGYKLVDEFGADSIGQYMFTTPGGATFNDNLSALALLAEREDVGHGWPLELVRHIANARWDQKRGQIVTDVVTSLKPLFAEIASAVAGIKPERFAELIQEGLSGVVVQADTISDTDRDEIAKAVREQFRTDPLA